MTWFTTLRGIYATCLAVYRHWNSVRAFVSVRPDAAGDTVGRGLLDAAHDLPADMMPPRGIAFDAEVVDVIDGDTVEVEVRLRHRVRLEDCWCEEKRLGPNTDEAGKQRGLAAKAHMEGLMAACDHKVRVLITGNGGDLYRQTTLSRVLGRLWRVIDDRSPDATDVSGLMVKAGHATTTKHG